jgi:hypothetical protein
VKPLVIGLLVAIVILGEQTPKQVSPEVVKAMQKRVTDESLAPLATLKDVRSIKAKIDILTIQLNGLSEELTKLRNSVSDKDMSRVALLEDSIKEIKEQKLQLEIKQQKEHDDMMAWVRPIAITVLTSMLIGMYSAVRHSMVSNSIRNSMKVLKEHTDGMVQQIAGMSKEAGRQEEKQEERDRVEGKEG